MWKSRTLFSTFPSIVRKVWENPGIFPGFFHAFPQYGISMKHAISNIRINKPLFLQVILRHGIEDIFVDPLPLLSFLLLAEDIPL